MVGNNPNVDKDLIKELSLLLDPRGDDGYLKQDEFVKTGIKVAFMIIRNYYFYLIILYNCYLL